VKVAAADGRVWNVRRRIRWPRLRRFGEGLNLDSLTWIDVPTGVSDTVATLVIGLVFAVVVAVLIVVFLPIVVFVFEALIIVVAAVALRRPWLVIASTAGPPAEERRWLVRGLFESRRAAREVADELRRGVHAEPQVFERDF
jgi:hypothetical protein